MAITNLGNKLYSGTKSDRKSASLGSSVDGTNTGVELSTGHIKQSIGSHTGNNGGNYYRAGYRALGSTLNTNWVLRFRYKPTALNSNSGNRDGDGMGIFITDRAYDDNTHDGSVGTTKAIGYAFRSKDSNTTWYYNAYAGTSSSSDSGIMHHSGGQTDFSDQATVDEEYYVEIIKNGTTVTVTQRSGSHSASATETETLTTSLSGFTHISIVSFDGNGGTQPVIEAEIRDIELWDNATSASGTATWSGISGFTHGTGTTGYDYKLGTGAYKLDNTAEGRIEVGSASDWQFLHNTNAKFTVATWFKRPTAFTSMSGASSGLSGKNISWLCETTDGTDSGFSIKYDNRNDPDHQLQCEIINESDSAVCVIQQNDWYPDDDDWHHLAITYDATLSSTNMIAYLDGVQKGTANKTGTPSDVDSDSTLRIGGGVVTHARVGNWTLDDFGIWNRVLTATEISTLCGTTGSLDSDDFDNVYGSTQYARGFKVATSSSALKDKKVKAVTFYVRKGGSPTGTAYAKIYNGTTVVETNTTGTNLDVSTLGTSDYTAHKFEFTGNTTLDTGYSVVYYFDGGSGSAYTQIRRQGSDVYDGVNTIYRKYHSSAWADDSGTDAKFILEFANPQLVSSLTDKSELKAYYSMDSTDLTPTVTHSNSNFGTWGETGSQVTESSNVITADIQTRTANHASTVDLGSNLNTSKWAMRFKLDYNTITRSNTSTFYLDIGIASADHSTALSNSGVGLDFIALQHRASSDTHGWGVVAYYNSGSLDNPEDSTFTTAPSTTGGDGNGVYYVEIIRYMDGSTNKMSIELFSDSSYSTSIEKISKNIHVNSTDALRYVRISNGTVGSGSTGNRITAIVSDIKVYDGIDTFKGCANDFSSTSDLEGLTGVRTNSIFQQTDNTPSYWWYNGTSWVLDGTTLAIDEDFSTNNFTSNDTNVTNVVDGALTYWGAGQNTYGDGAYYKTPVTLDDNKWVMRARYEIEAWASPSGDSYQVFVGMIKFTTAANAQGVSASYNQDGISFGHRIGTGTNGIRIGASNVGGQLYNNFETLTSLTGTRTCWIELTRLSSTTSKLEVFSDEGFTTSIGATPTLTHGAVTGLDTIMINSQQGNGTGGANHGNIDNLQIQNGTSEWLE